ncbi:hypothetical protein BS78_08G067600 [Paspalum vaginatum]|nr:hypothetical protein BS78_08G067600 [Paspalum vaginatum]KAJ1265311.1 hypothetical protein BS78_08G067600 [Paspalum vaginatum]
MTSNPIHFVVSAAAPNPSLPGDHATDGDHATAPNPPQPLPTRRRPETRRPRPTPAPAPTRRRPSTLRRTATPRPRPTPVCCGSISPAASISSSPPRLPTLPRRLASLRHPAQPQLPPPPPRVSALHASSRTFPAASPGLRCPPRQRPLLYGPHSPVFLCRPSRFNFMQLDWCFYAVWF